LDVAGNLAAVTETRKRMNDSGIEVSLFIAPDPAQIEAASRSGSQFIELHTGAFAESFHNKSKGAAELERLITGAKQAHGLGLKVNAGHGLNYQEPAYASSRAATRRVEHRPQHRQPRGDGW